MSGHTQRDRILQFARDAYGAEAERLWARFPDYMVLRHPVSRKWYAIIMDIPKSKLGLVGEEPVDVLDIKCDPIMVGSLLSGKGFLPAYHMNKNTWVTALLDESLPDEAILPLLDLSYDSVAPKRRKRS